MNTQRLFTSSLRPIAAIVTLELGAALPAWSQTPYLVKDVNAGPADGGGRTFASIGDRVFFYGTRPDLGVELWTSAGTAASTIPIEITPGVGDTFLKEIAVLGGDFVFGGARVWKTDGTLAGTQEISAAGHFLSDTTHGSVISTNPGLSVFASANRVPMRTDGTPGGTFALVDASLDVRIVQSALPITSFGGGFVFMAQAPSSHGVWRTDGTAAGTARFLPGCVNVQAAAGRLFVTGGIPGGGGGLLISDGTTEGTSVLKEGGSNPVVEVDGTFYFTVPTSPTHWELWLSDGTVAGTRPLSAVAPVPPDLDPDALTASNGVLYFVGHTAQAGAELWRTDGTAAGTYMLRDIEPGPGSAFLFMSTFNWDRRLAPFAGGLIFSAYSGPTGFEVWVTDGTTAGTVPLAEITPGPEPVWWARWPASFMPAGRRVFFSAHNVVYGRELWAVDLPPGVVSVADVSIVEGNATATASFAVRLLSPAATPVIVSYATVAGTAQAQTDFIAQSGVLTFAPGTMEQPVVVPILGDLAHEADESFRLELTSVSGGTFADRRGLAVVVDDDAPSARVSDASVTEGDAGTVDAVFGVTLTTRDGGPTALPTTVRFTTSRGTANGLDFTAAAGSLTFPAGLPSGSTLPVLVPVLGDTLDEPDEFFEVELVPYGGNALVSGTPGRGVILDDDGIHTARPLEVGHGSNLRATLAPPPGRTLDLDYYVVALQGDASYEAVIDEVSGDAVPIQLDLVHGLGGSGQPVGTGSSVSLRWQTPEHLYFPLEQVVLRVQSAACGSACAGDDGYRLRVYETTLRASRFNNSGGQATVALLQNASAETVSGYWNLWSDVGERITLAGQPFQLAPRATAAIDLAALVPGQSGSMTVRHDGRYGSLAGKLVTIGLSSGFSFDTPMTYRAR